VGNAKDLARQIARLLDDRALASALGGRARRRIFETYSQSEMIEAHASFIDDCMAQSKLVPESILQLKHYRDTSSSWKSSNRFWMRYSLSSSLTDHLYSRWMIKGGNRIIPKRSQGELRDNGCA